MLVLLLYLVPFLLSMLLTQQFIFTYSKITIQYERMKISGFQYKAEPDIAGVEVTNAATFHLDPTVSPQSEVSSPNEKVIRGKLRGMNGHGCHEK